jgi:glucose/arabinose dehydrogenase
VDLQAPPGDPRVFVLEQRGLIRVIENGRLRPRPFLDLRSVVGSRGNEQGLLGLAFHPDYARNRTLYVNYTDHQGDTRIVRYLASSTDPNAGDPASAAEILHVEQPYSNHNGGGLAFGPDGMLWIGLGDGGSGGDPHGNGQNLGTLLGKMLRIDVDHGTPYAIPVDNPFRNRRGARPEIWAYGLRNPWRYSFDLPTRTLWIGDVGQDRFEEVDAVPLSDAGANFGWNLKEARHCFGPAQGCDRPGLTDPVLEIPASEAKCVTGGIVYRGRAVPALQGVYVFGDYTYGWVGGFRLQNGQVTDRVRYRIPGDLHPSSFGRDASGELYVVDHGGRVLRVVGVR